MVSKRLTRPGCPEKALACTSFLQVPRARTPVNNNTLWTLLDAEGVASTHYLQLLWGRTSPHTKSFWGRSMCPALRKSKQRLQSQCKGDWPHQPPLEQQGNLKVFFIVFRSDITSLIWRKFELDSSLRKWTEALPSSRMPTRVHRYVTCIVSSLYIKVGKSLFAGAASQLWNKSIVVDSLCFWIWIKVGKGIVRLT